MYECNDFGATVLNYNFAIIQLINWNYFNLNIMQNENSASLRAGSTKTKNASKGGFGSNIRYRLYDNSARKVSASCAPQWAVPKPPNLKSTTAWWSSMGKSGRRKSTFVVYTLDWSQSVTNSSHKTTWSCWNPNKNSSGKTSNSTSWSLKAHSLRKYPFTNE